MTPQDLAWFLASYAREAKSRIEGVDLEALKTVRTALEEALGLKFEGTKGEKLLPLHAGANALLRRLLRLGALGQTAPARLQDSLQLA